MYLKPTATKGRGSVSNTTGRYEAHTLHAIDDGWHTYSESEASLQIEAGQSQISLDDPLRAYVCTAVRAPVRTRWRDDNTKSIITRNRSPDIHFDRSVNPYRGCEHGCIYCFARPTHTWLGHSAGLDFETKLYAKRNAAELLKQELAKPSYQCEPIAIGVNTDAYQPLEKQLKITRSVLQVLLEAQHPAYLITKSSLVERDIDLLQQMAQSNLVSVCLSVTTLNRELARKLEPRATSPHRRLQTLQNLSDAGIPTRVSISPVIPALNEEEIDNIIMSAANAGVSAAYAIVLRLPHELQQLFPEWLYEHYPLRAERILKAIRSIRENKLNNADFNTRMRGCGPRADIIQQRLKLACKRANISVGRDFQLNTSHFVPPVFSATTQMNLFA